MKIKHIDLPKDIQKIIKKKIMLCVVKFSLFEILAVAISINLLTWERFILNTELAFRCFLVAILILSPFFIAKFPFKLIDKSWCGIVTKVDIREDVGAYATGTKVWPYTKHTIYLTIKKDDGETIEIKAKEFGRRTHKGFEVPCEADIRNYLDIYSVGDIVYRFYLLENYYVVKQKSEKIDCVVCGAENHKNTTNCINCGHSLIKIDD